MNDLPNSANAARATWGAEFLDNSGVRFRLWAPGESAVTLRLSGRDLPMKPVGDGWFQQDVADATAGDEYVFLLADGKAVPDPAARAQAGDVHGPSLVADPAYVWKSGDWHGRPWEDAVVMEIHIGTFTPEGTFAAAAAKLLQLAETGITAIEVMPVAQFSGERGWGYDGVLHYASHPAYGTPADFKAFIDTAHGHGIMVLLDVVYNHFGPDGNYLHLYAPDFFRADRQTPWGAAINFSAEPVRRFFIENALYWIGEFELDGLRLDAVEQIYDTSEMHVLSAISQAVHDAFPERQVHLVVEDQRNLRSLLERSDGSAANYTAEWNDDFHHVAHIIATGETIGHYTHFSDALWHKVDLALQHGFIFPDRADPPTLPTERTYLPPTAFIDFLQNHDQIGNRAFGERLISLSRPEVVQALTAIMLLSPHIPMLFMGEEYGETQPFYFFTDYTGELGDIVRKGRMAEAEGFGGLKDGKTAADLPDPNALSTFEGSKLRWHCAESEEGRRWQGLIREVLAQRRKYVVPLLKRGGKVEATTVDTEDGAVAIDWTFDGARLELRANLADRPVRLPASRGATIFELNGSGHPASVGGVIEPYSVMFSITPSTNRAAEKIHVKAERRRD